MSPVVIGYFILAAVAANLPFAVDRILFVIKAPSGKKHIAVRLMELFVLYVLIILLGRWLEGRQGPVHSKDFLSFYLPTFALFVIAGYPGFVVRYFWRKPGM